MKTPSSACDLIQPNNRLRLHPSSRAILTELTLDPPGATSDQAGVPVIDEDYLILSTIHSARARNGSQCSSSTSWTGCIPSDLGTGTPSAEIEEERRLLMWG